MVRAKFTLVRTENTIHNTGESSPDGTWKKTEMRTLVFAPVYGKNDPEHENSKFWKLTPSGEIKLGTISREAWEQFELGKEYYIDFSLAE